MNTNLDDSQSVNPIGFVIPTGKSEVTVSEAMSSSFEKCKEYRLNPLWISENDLLQIKPSMADVIILDQFSGPGYDHVTAFRCTVLGPSVLLSCIPYNRPVPNLPYPVFNTAMKGMIVSSTGLELSEKKRLKALVEKMAGIYTNAFHDGVTHLITGTTKSDKYRIAVKKEVPCMLPDWIEEVWKLSQNDPTVSAVDSRFINHRCPPLLGVTITVSQLNRADKDLIKRTVEKHGGTYSGVLEMGSTTALICTSPDGEKYSHAKKWNIPCVSSRWIFDCIEKGICLSTKSYRVEKRNSDQHTMPLRESVNSPSVSPNKLKKRNSESYQMKSRVDETMNDSVFESAKENSNIRNNGLWLSELELSKVKKAGCFLDGCRIFLSGFTETEQHQLSRVLKYAGGVRLTQLVESVTHCVNSVATKNVVPETSKILEDLDLSPNMVSLQWIVECMNLGKPAPVSEFIFPTVTDDNEPIGSIINDQQHISKSQIDAENDTLQFEASLLAQYGL